MTKENREKAYAHFRDLEKNYEALPHLDNGVTKTSYLRKKAGKDADKLLAREKERKELGREVSEKILEEEKPVEEVKEVKKTKKSSKGD